MDIAVLPLYPPSYFLKTHLGGRGEERPESNLKVQLGMNAEYKKYLKSNQ